MAKILFAVKEENEDWQEELITEYEERIPDAIEWAKENGYNRFRIWEFVEGDKPDFASTVNL